MFFCPLSQIQDREVARIIKECKQESFWYRGEWSKIILTTLTTQNDFLMYVCKTSAKCFFVGRLLWVNSLMLSYALYSQRFNWIIYIIVVGKGGWIEVLFNQNFSSCRVGSVLEVHCNNHLRNVLLCYILILAFEWKAGVAMCLWFVKFFVC